MKLADAGVNKEQIGRKYGVTGDAIYRRLSRKGSLGEFARRQKDGKERLDTQNIIFLRLDGWSTHEIHESLGIPVERVAKALHEAVVNSKIDTTVCDFCGKGNDYAYSSGRFCQEKCARSESTRDISPESRQKQIDTLRSLHRYSVKENDQKILKPLKLHKRYRRYYEPNMELKRKRTSHRRSQASKAAVQKRIENGTHRGWTKRGKSLASYAEKYWASVLDKNGIEYASEYSIAKSELGLSGPAAYFLDFIILTSNGSVIDLEVDGKQHKYPDRAASDRVRDAALRKKNFIVYRIDWVNPAHDRPTVERQVTDLLDFLQSHGV